MTSAKNTQRRAKGEGSIYKDKKTGRWIAQLDVGRDSRTGKRRRVKVTGRTKTEASNRLKGIASEAEKGRDVSKKALTVAELVEQWAALGYPIPGTQKRKEASTIAALERRVRNHLVPALGHLRVRDLTVEQIEGWWAAEMARFNYARNTMLDFRGDIVQLVGFARKRRKIDWNPAKEATMPNGRDARERPTLDRAQLRALYDALSGHQLEAYFVLLAELGLRPGEADGLTWDSVHIDDDGQPAVVNIRQAMKRADGRALEVGAPKTDWSNRTLQLTDTAVAALRRHRARQAERRLAIGALWSRDERWAGLVFLSEVGTPMHPSNTRRTLTKACERAGVPVVTPYELRHSAATILHNEDGVSYEALADLLGHRTTRMVQQVYRHRPDVIVVAADAEGRRTAPSGALGTTLAPSNAASTRGRGRRAV